MVFFPQHKPPAWNPHQPQQGGSQSTPYSSAATAIARYVQKLYYFFLRFVEEKLLQSKTIHCFTFCRLTGQINFLVEKESRKFLLHPVNWSLLTKTTKRKNWSLVLSWSRPSEAKKACWRSLLPAEASASLTMTLPISLLPAELLKPHTNTSAKDKIVKLQIVVRKMISNVT